MRRQELLKAAGAGIAALAAPRIGRAKQIPAKSAASAKPVQNRRGRPRRNATTSSPISPKDSDFNKLQS
jgi:hypothetical protein